MIIIMILMNIFLLINRTIWSLIIKGYPLGVRIVLGAIQS